MQQRNRVQKIWLPLLKEDKPAVFSDSKTGVEVHFSNKEKTVIKGLKVERVQASDEEKKYFAGEDAHVFEIEGLDEKVKTLISLTLLL